METTQGFHDPGTGSKRLSLVVSDPLCLRFNYSRVTWDLRHSSLTVNQKAREYSLLPSQTTLTRSREGKHQSSLAHVSSSRLSCVNHCSPSSPATKLSVLPSRGQPHGPSCHCGVVHSSGVEPALQGVSETQKLTEEQDRPGEQMRQGSRLCFLLQ
jgi:hypothetical protein